MDSSAGDKLTHETGEMSLQNIQQAVESNPANIVESLITTDAEPNYIPSADVIDGNNAHEIIDITEMMPVIDDSDNNSANETNKDEQMVIDLDIIDEPSEASVDMTDRKGDEEPMDIDEILNSINSEPECSVSSEELHDIQSKLSAPGIQTGLNKDIEGVGCSADIENTIVPSTTVELRTDLPTGTEGNALYFFECAKQTEPLSVERTSNLLTKENDEIIDIDKFCGPIDIDDDNPAGEEANLDLSAEGTVNESVSVFDLLLENEDLFGKVDTDASESLKTEDVQTSDGKPETETSEPLILAGVKAEEVHKETDLKENEQEPASALIENVSNDNENVQIITDEKAVDENIVEIEDDDDELFEVGPSDAPKDISTVNEVEKDAVKGEEDITVIEDDDIIECEGSPAESAVATKEGEEIVCKNVAAMEEVLGVEEDVTVIEDDEVIVESATSVVQNDVSEVEAKIIEPLMGEKDQGPVGKDTIASKDESVAENEVSTFQIDASVIENEVEKNDSNLEEIAGDKTVPLVATDDIEDVVMENELSEDNEIKEKDDEMKIDEQSIGDEVIEEIVDEKMITEESTVAKEPIEEISTKENITEAAKKSVTDETKMIEDIITEILDDESIGGDLSEETPSEGTSTDAKTEKSWKECLNIDCLKKSDQFYRAPEFIINHFSLGKSQKMLYACEDCYNNVTEYYGELCAALVDKQPLFLQNIKHSNCVEIIDSSDEDEPDNKEDSGRFDADTLNLIEMELEAVIADTLEKVDIKQQMEWNRQILSAKLANNEKNCMEMMDDISKLQKTIDKMYADTYCVKHNFIDQLESIDLDTHKPMQICNETYPPTGKTEYAEIQLNTMYYSFRKKMLARWIPCKVIEKIQADVSMPYKVRFCQDFHYANNTKIVYRKHLAYGQCPEKRLNIGTRVIALSRNTELTRKKTAEFTSNFYPGVIAETLSSYTNWRYLVFFDDGFVQYVHHDNVRLVCESPEKVWELIEEPGARTFIEGYLKEFKKKRPIVQVRTGQRIQTEFANKWYNAVVSNVDGSLVQVFFDDVKRYEWIYRGSTRLFPLYRKLRHLNPSANRNEATIEYIVIDDKNEPERSIESPKISQDPVTSLTQHSKVPGIQRTFASQAARDTPQQKQRDQKRAVAKKSTNPTPKPVVHNMNNSTIYVDEDKPKGKVIYYTAKKHFDVKKYITHVCQPSCLIQITNNLNAYSPLSKPLLSGFDRQICRTKFNKKSVVYKAPCGRRIRNMLEMHKYLRLTNCKLNVDNFSFDPLIHCLAEYVIESYVTKKQDLSGGIEKMPVQLVNCYDNTMPPPCTYSDKRIQTEGVNLNLDPEFLCGCDCTDDCMDKSKCACWQLTLQGSKYGNPDTPVENIGYEFKRLPDPVPTGIYECNSQCKCNATCLNRVVQHPLQMKLQVFKTVNRGWGLRCLNDVPKGSFICCYAGNLLTETAANEAGGELGDEYFAELDYIEVVENMKEGYEPEVVNDDIESSSSDDDFDVEKESLRTRNNDSDDEFVAKSYSVSEDSESRRYRTRNSLDAHKKTIAKEAEKRKERNNSSDEDQRQVKNFMASNNMPLSGENEEVGSRSIRELFGGEETVYIMDAKKAGNIGRYFNHSCGPNLFVQNVFVDTHDLRLPWVAFFASTHIRAGTELTWNYNYEVGSVPGKVLICQCGDEKCRGRIL